MNLGIVDYNIQQEPKIAKYIQIRIVELNFNVSAKFAVYFFLSENANLDYVSKVEYVDILGDEYKGWNNDDNYIINLVLMKLGLTKK